MADANLALTERLLQEPVPRRARCSGKTLALLFAVISLELVDLLSQEPWTSGRDAEDLAVEPAITMAMPHTQLAKFRPFLQPARTQLFSQPVKVWQPMQLPKIGQSMQPSRIQQFMHSAVPASKGDTATGTAPAVAAKAKVTSSADAVALPSDIATATDDFADRTAPAAASSGRKEKIAPSVFSVAKFIQLKTKLLDVFKMYGPLALGFHFTIWSLTLGSSFTVVSFGLPIEGYLPANLLSLLPSGSGNLAVAYVLTEVTGPFRTLFTLATVPVLGKKLSFEKAQKVELPVAQRAPEQRSSSGPLVSASGAIGSFFSGMLPSLTSQVRSASEKVLSKK